MSSNSSEQIERIRVLRSQIYNKVSSISEVFDKLLKYKTEFIEVHTLETSLLSLNKKEVNRALKEISLDIIKQFSRCKQGQQTKEDLVNLLKQEEDRFFEDFITKKVKLIKDHKRPQRKRNPRTPSGIRWKMSFGQFEENQDLPSKEFNCKEYDLGPFDLAHWEIPDDFYNLI